jgi:hypothetical protein
MHSSRVAWAAFDADLACGGARAASRNGGPFLTLRRFHRPVQLPREKQYSEARFYCAVSGIGPAPSIQLPGQPLRPIPNTR